MVGHTCGDLYISHHIGRFDRIGGVVRALTRNAPRAGAVALELVNAPARRPDNAVHVGRRDQHREDVAQPPHQIITEFPAVVVFDEAQQAPVPDAPNYHAEVYATTVQMSRLRCTNARSYVSPSP